MEKTGAKVNNWIIVVIVMSLAIALLVTTVGIEDLEVQVVEQAAQIKEQTEQIEQMTRDLEQCEEMKKTHAVERSIFDDIINGLVSIDVGMTHISEPLGSRNEIKY